MTPGSGAISCAVEGPVDEAILRVLLNYCGIRPAGIYGKRGKSFLRQKVHSYNQAASYYPWIILVDLNHEAECAPALRTLWLPNPAPGMFFRIAIECLSALSQKRVAGEIDGKRLNRLIKMIKTDINSLEIIHISDTVLDKAQEIVLQRPARAMDAIHIASALTFQEMADVSSVFITSDRKQYDVAMEMGLNSIFVI